MADKETLTDRFDGVRQEDPSSGYEGLLFKMLTEGMEFRNTDYGDQQIALAQRMIEEGFRHGHPGVSFRTLGPVLEAMERDGYKIKLHENQVDVLNPNRMEEPVICDHDNRTITINLTYQAGYDVSENDRVRESQREGYLNNVTTQENYILQRELSAMGVNAAIALDYAALWYAQRAVLEINHPEIDFDEAKAAYHKRGLSEVTSLQAEQGDRSIYDVTDDPELRLALFYKWSVDRHRDLMGRDDPLIKHYDESGTVTKYGALSYEARIKSNELLMTEYATFKQRNDNPADDLRDTEELQNRQVFRNTIDDIKNPS